MPGMSRAVREAIAAAREPSLDAGRRWRGGPEMQALAAAFADCPLDRAEPAADRAETLFADIGWVEALLAPLVGALAGDPFFEPPVKASRDSVRTGIVLFDCPVASISASVLRADALAAAPAPGTAVVSGRIVVTHYFRAGGAVLRRWEAEPLAPDFTAATAPPCRPLPPTRLLDGDVIRTDGRTRAQLVTGATRDLVTLVATIRAGAAPLIREYDVESGALVRVASADDGASRTEMLLTFLRNARRTDAGPQFDAATHDPAFHARWAAMREWLALDAAAALPRLETMAAQDPNSEVRAAAAATLRNVRLRVAEARRCRA
ncbi:hypothetical protein [Sphingosinithalassobacter sp. LHW66-3]|uniref:hypothetical protein n=1 Tax=Sphingosinithalassobacter sp. LHW66-3 TaxID=3424718 RepID=UPI003D6A546C